MSFRVYLSETGTSAVDKLYDTVAIINDGDVVSFTFKNGDSGDDLKIYINGIQASVTKTVDDNINFLFSSFNTSRDRQDLRQCCLL